MCVEKLATEEAVDLICGPRMEFYGPPEENLQDIADVWTPYVMRALEAHEVLSATDVTMMMIMLKAIRQVRGYHKDSTVDIAGYAELAEVMNDPQARHAFIRRAAEKINNKEEARRFILKFVHETSALPMIAELEKEKEK